MSTPPFSSLEFCSPESFHNFQTSALMGCPAGLIEDLVQKVDRALNMGVLCPHISSQILFLHGRITNQATLPDQDKQALSLLIEKVENAVNTLLTLPDDQTSSQDLIKLCYLSQLSPLLSSDTALIDAVFQRRRERVDSFPPALIARQLPYCLLPEQFINDFQLLTGLNRDSKIFQRPIKISDLAKLRERRHIFLKQPNATESPPYLDQLLKGGFVHLYGYLLRIAECGGENKHSEIKSVDASELSRIVLDVRHAIVEHVKHAVGKGHQNIVFLVGNTGSGKSTTAALLQREPLKRKDERYEVPGKHTIGHGLTTSCTLLPNVHSNGTYVDFPGFNDTRGELIDLGIELAFKALVEHYKPKVVIVESMMALESSRGTPVRKLGRKLTRMLGKEAPCSVFLTQYLQLVSYAHLENALENKKRLEGQITKLKSAILSIEGGIERLEQTLSEIPTKEKKIKECKKKIQDIEESITELEQKKRQGPLTNFEEKTLPALQKKLLKKRKGLRQIQQLSNDSPERGRLEAQITAKREKSGEKQAKIWEKSEQLRTYEEQILKAQKSLEDRSQKLIELLGIELDKERRVAELRELEDPNTLNICKEVLDTAMPIEGVYKKLSDDYRGEMIRRFKRALTDGGLPPPPPLEIDDLQQRVLNTSLTALLTAKSSPEIGAFLHLSEMEPECAEELDRHIVSEFSDTLVRLIVIGSLEKKPKEDPIKNFIEKQIKALNKKQVREAIQLQERWSRLKERVLDKSTVGATNWEELKQHYHLRLANTLYDIDEVRKQHLEQWDRWAANFFGIKDLIVLPKRFYANQAEFSANQLVIEELGKIIDGLNRSFDMIRELRTIVEHKKDIEEQQQKCTDALKDPVRFPQEIQAAINETQQIYDKGAGREEKWKDRLGKINTVLRAKAPEFYSILREGSCLVSLMRAGLCSQADSDYTFIYQLVEMTSPEDDFSDLARAIARAEQLLELENDFQEEDFLNRVRAINHKLAQKVELNIEISLYRILLLAFLMEPKQQLDSSPTSLTKFQRMAASGEIWD